MKTLTIAIVGMCFSLAAGESPSSVPPLRRAPYKEVRTKANHDPKVREAKRKEIERKREEKEAHRKKVQAEFDSARSKRPNSSAPAKQEAKTSPGSSKPTEPGSSNSSTNSTARQVLPK